jgi:hypothetical protein
MKSLILAALAAVTFAFAGFAGADLHKETNSTFPEGSIQTSPE